MCITYISSKNSINMVATTPDFLTSDYDRLHQSEIIGILHNFRDQITYGDKNSHTHVAMFKPPGLVNYPK